MQDLDRDEVSLFVKAPPEAVYALVADVTRMPEFSPEIVRCTWLGGVTEPDVGARFEAVNKVHGRLPWKNRPVVTVADAGREFAFQRTEKFSGTVAWRYQFESEGEGTRVTESYEVTAPLSRLGWFVIERVFGRKDRRADLRRGMQETLFKLRQVAETGVGDVSLPRPRAL